LTIHIQCSPAAEGWRCRVSLAEKGGATAHDVTVRRTDLNRLDPGAVDPEHLVRRSFDFLLEREPKENILETFDLSVITDYYPEYEREILGGPQRG
jgi:hypothetical protein